MNINIMRKKFMRVVNGYRIQSSTVADNKSRRTYGLRYIKCWKCGFFIAEDAIRENLNWTMCLKFNIVRQTFTLTFVRVSFTSYPITVCSWILYVYASWQVFKFAKFMLIEYYFHPFSICRKRLLNYWSKFTPMKVFFWYEEIWFRNVI